ncbi:hypothetical protein D3A96_10620 [Robertkochia marina]|nr:hypothetical protein D3A96_10620 [Robertkochia marina]
MIPQENPNDAVEEFCKFEGYKGSLKKYWTEMYLGDSIEWRGVAKDTTYIINITGIVFDQGQDPFLNGFSDLQGFGKKGNKKRGKPSKGTNKEWLKYSILFTVQKGDSISETIKIDPELRIETEM